MRLGGPLSFALHIGILAAGVIVAPQILRDDAPAPMMVLPVELLTIADTTNMAPVFEEMKTDEVAEEAMAPEAAASEAAAAAAPESAEILPTEKAPEPKKEEKPAEKEVEAPKKPTPKKAEDEGMDSFLKTIQKNKQKAPVAGKTANDPTRVTDAQARPGVGDNSKMTVSIADYIRSQLMEKGCWADQEDMADSRRLRAVIRVKFERNGKMAGAPELIEPARPPSGDQPMQIFVQRAYRALHQCEPFDVPAEYFKVTPARWIDLTFVP